VLAWLFGHEIVVREGWAGLVYYDGVYRRELGPGRHRLSHREEVERVITARQLLVVAGQEVLSQDSYPVRVTIVLTVQVTDAHRAQTAHQDGYLEVLRLEVQLAARTLISSRPAEALAVAARDELDAELQAVLGPLGAASGVTIDSVRLRDVHLPADLRRMLTAVDRARREGQASLERAHAEQASLRALANAARMLRNNPELQNLRLLQAMGGAGAPTLVLGAAGLVPLASHPAAEAAAMPE
jgi:regulator of protease activity HflC (stomatin/prohibitin superfamily)